MITILATALLAIAVALLAGWQLHASLGRKRDISIDGMLYSIEDKLYDLKHKAQFFWAMVIRPHIIVGLDQDAEYPEPPTSAQYLLYFLPRRVGEPLLGDLAEIYPIIWHKFGPRRAWFWYNVQAVLSFVVLLGQEIGKLLTSPLAALLGELYRRISH